MSHSSYGPYCQLFWPLAHTNLNKFCTAIFSGLWYTTLGPVPKPKNYELTKINNTIHTAKRNRSRERRGRTYVARIATFNEGRDTYLNQSVHEIAFQNNKSRTIQIDGKSPNDTKYWQVRSILRKLTSCTPLTRNRCPLANKYNRIIYYMENIGWISPLTTNKGMHSVQGYTTQTYITNYFGMNVPQPSTREELINRATKEKALS